jgi:hypothetical protein
MLQNRLKPIARVETQNLANYARIEKPLSIELICGIPSTAFHPGMRKESPCNSK